MSAHSDENKTDMGVTASNTQRDDTAGDSTGNTGGDSTVAKDEATPGTSRQDGGNQSTDPNGKGQSATEGDDREPMSLPSIELRQTGETERTDENGDTVTPITARQSHVGVTVSQPPARIADLGLNKAKQTSRVTTDVKSQRSLHSPTKVKKKRTILSPPGPFSNNLVLQNGRIPAAKQQSTLFKPIKTPKISPRPTPDNHVFRLPALSGRYIDSNQSLEEKTESPPKVQTSVRVNQRRAKSTVKQQKLKLSKSEANYVRLAKMVARVGTDVLRVAFANYLERQHPPRKLHDFLAGNKRRLKSYASSYKLISNRWDILYPEGGETKTKIEQLDAAVIFWFIRFICHLKRPNDFIWKRKPPGDDLSETADIARLRDFRNFLINLSHPSVYDDEFERKVDDLKQICTRLCGERLGETFIKIIDEMKGDNARLQDRQQHLQTLTKWANETGDMHIAPAKSSGETIRERKEMTRRFLEKHRNPKVFVRTKTYIKAQEKLEKSGCVILKGNTGDGKTTMAISLMVAAFDEDECLLITSPDQWTHVDPKSVSVILMDDIFGSGSLDERLLSTWETRFDEIYEMTQDTKERPGIRVIITVRHQILEQCTSRLASHKLFSKDRFFDIVSSELYYAEKRAMLSRHIVAANRGLAKADIDKSAKAHNSRLGFPQCCALYVCREGFRDTGAQFFDNPAESLLQELDKLFELDNYSYLALTTLMFQKDGILYVEKLEQLDQDPQFTDRLMDLACLCQITETEHVNAFVLNGLELMRRSFVTYYEDRDCYTFSHESIMEAMMASFGERHPQEVLEGCSLSFLMDFVGTDTNYDDTKDEIFLMRVKKPNFAVLAKVFEHYILRGEPKRISQHRAMNDVRFLDFFFEIVEKREKVFDILLSVDNNFRQARFPDRKVGLLYGAVDQELPNLDLVVLILKTGVHKGKISERGCQEELDGAIEVAVRRGSYGIYMALIEYGVELPDRLLQEEKYLVSVDIVRDMIKRRHWSDEQKDIALVRASRGLRPESQDIVTILLQEGAAVSSVRAGTTALCEAVKSGKLKTVALLLSSGASVDDRDARQQTPLHHACDWNNIEVVKLLLKRNADVNTRDTLGFTPFLVAAGWGRETIMELILKRRVDALVTDDQDNNVLHICSANGQTKMMRMALEAYPKEMNSILISRNRHGWTPLDFALRCGHLGVTKVLIYSILKTHSLKANPKTFVHTRFYVVKLEDFEHSERYQSRFLNSTSGRTCFQMPRGSWFIQAGSREEYEQVRQFSIKFESKLRQCLAKS